MQDMIARNKILEIRSGSHLYGTNVETSDEDFTGIFIADEEYYLGLKSVEEIDLSIQSKNISGRNTTEAVDRKFHEFRKFCKLALDNNPNILEMLFVNNENVVSCNRYGQSLRQNAELFPWVGCAQKFLGYAFSQKHKMKIKPDNMEKVLSAYGYLLNLLETNRRNSLIVDIQDDLIKMGFVEHHQHIKVGDIYIQRNATVKSEFDKLKRRIGSFTNRQSLISRYGYDTKFGMHLIRLMMEGKELLETGEIEYPLKDRSLLLDIRNGKYTCEEVITMSEEFEKEVESLKETTKLPKHPRFNDVNAFLIDTVKDFHAAN